MTGTQAFLSWANHLRDQLDGKDGLSVVIELNESVQPPFLLVQDGPDWIRGWKSRRMCQGSLVVKADSSKAELPVLMSRYLQLVTEFTRNCGALPKWDYSTTPETQNGHYNPVLSGISGPLHPRDDMHARQVVTWELHSPNK